MANREYNQGVSYLNMISICIKKNTYLLLYRYVLDYTSLIGKLCTQHLYWGVEVLQLKKYTSWIEGGGIFSYLELLSPPPLTPLNIYIFVNEA